ncbi:helix-turn-helix domain-containing protein [Amycolatopsis jiangsuensis]|uniref:AraC-like DNA-binding protein n=1 Tax=Amycolatopsis jiangsuensis TaxID=1181879 RepID=A0A840IS95_9PSEU|nr:AraC family transcriptional regulator [Amycolatopsis jiangsuensis]MBB4684082.1 AraC-like DNA-binding protein [Amycolatopsis jiangsuensis]
MRPGEWARDGAAVWKVAVPDQPGRLPGVRMAGFTGRTTDLIDLPLIPYPAVTLFLDFGDALLITDGGGETRCGSAVAGLAPRGARGVGQNIDCLQIRLSPPVAHAVLNAVAAVSGTVVAFADLWTADRGRLQERLRDTGSWAERFALAEDALAHRYAAGPALDPEVSFAWHRLVAGRGRVRVDRLAAESGWSRQRLWSRFRAQIGVTPKRAARLIRFDEAVHRLAAGGRAAAVAAETGYADQSHLHREITAFTGMNPSTVATTPWLAVDDVAWPAPTL